MFYTPSNTEYIIRTYMSQILDAFTSLTFVFVVEVQVIIVTVVL